MRRLAPGRGPLFAFTAFGVVTGFLVGWLMVGRLLAGVVLAALVVVALGGAFAFLAFLIALVPPSSARSRATGASTSMTKLPGSESAKEKSADA